MRLRPLFAACLAVAFSMAPIAGWVTSSAAAGDGQPAPTRPAAPAALAANSALSCHLVRDAGPAGGSQATPLAVPAVAIVAPGQSGLQPPAAATTVADLRVTLARLLAAHSFLVLQSMRAAAQTSADGPAMLDALNGNTNDLTAAVAGVYGPAAGQQFESLWQRHISDVLAYARAVVSKDSATEQAAIADLDGYRRDFVAFITRANPFVDPNAEAVSLQMHITQLLTFAASDYGAAYAAEREAFVHMFDFGDQLAQAIGRQFPDKFSGALALSPAGLLRVTLDRLLAEHAVLAAAAMRAKLAGSPDVSAVTVALGGNSQDIVTAIGQVYGDPAAGAFQAAWSKHISVYIGYIDAVQRHDEAARQRQIVALDGVADQLAEVLASANPRLSSTAVAAMLRHHSRALTDQVDAEAAGDYPRAVATVDEAYDHMFTIGDALASAISAQFPDRFRDITSVPPTSTSTDSRPAGPLDPLTLGLALLGGVAGLTLALAMLLTSLRNGRS